MLDVGTGQTVVAGREGAIAAESTAMHVSGGTCNENIQGGVAVMLGGRTF